MAGEPRHRFVVSRLWAGGCATALVAALAAIVVILVASGLFGVPVLVPSGGGAWGGIGATAYAACAAVAALAATGLLHLLLIGTPRARSFFVSIMLLLTAITVIVPLSIDADLGARIATAAGNLFLGVLITGTLSGVLHSAIRAGRLVR
ncbi:hypothetical protein GCM10027598_61330 [Amycolatopsis oliviviridis]|uniref:Uncharacterized protein n=1 Tax=Amycolatopsis oliviviridis TaxID=1471590 RepID=A0ABQ3M3M9_9PSEU|nr:DUF6069 family protein [Amycolatopsis oliviviridis]GHH32465.1 hypothetical protein GCM10017790_69620 [Amycolatopsis oliviviridis]